MKGKRMKGKWRGGRGFGKGKERKRERNGRNVKKGEGKNENDGEGWARRGKTHLRKCKLKGGWEERKEKEEGKELKGIRRKELRKRRGRR